MALSLIELDLKGPLAIPTQKYGVLEFARGSNVYGSNLAWIQLDLHSDSISLDQDPHLDHKVSKIF